MSPKLRTGFLQLPAELRNQIYEHLIEDIDTNFGSKTIRLRPRTEFSKYWRKKNPHRGNHYSLNQVCRATRHEFGPLYVSQVIHRIRVDSYALMQFPKSVYSGYTLENSFALAPKKIEIEFTSPPLYGTQSNASHLDIMPLITLCLNHKDIQCTFLGKFGPVPELHNLFWTHSQAWAAAIKDDLLEVRLYPSTGPLVGLVFHEDAEQDFLRDIPSCSQKSWKYAPPSMRAYLMELGAPEARTWDSHVDVHFATSKMSCDKLRQNCKGKEKPFEIQYRLKEN